MREPKEPELVWKTRPVKRWLERRLQETDGDVNDTVDTLYFLLERPEQQTAGDERHTMCKGVLISYSESRFQGPHIGP